MSKKLIELKTCPFCGAKAKRMKRFGMNFVTCSNTFCLVKPTTIRYDRMCDATKAWNKRKEEK